MNMADAVSVWGAVVSTTLGILRLVDAWRDRGRIEVSFSFHGDPYEGNDVIIRNLASKPLVIVYWELVWRHKRRLRWVESKNKKMSADQDFIDKKLEGYGTWVLTFSEADYFDWGWKAMGNDSIYLRLHFAGKKRPLVRKVYPV